MTRERLSLSVYEKGVCKDPCPYYIDSLETKKSMSTTPKDSPLMTVFGFSESRRGPRGSLGDSQLHKRVPIQGTTIIDLNLENAASKIRLRGRPRMRFPCLGRE